jgi:hypothetical protein
MPMMEEHHDPSTPPSSALVNSMDPLLSLPSSAAEGEHANEVQGLVDSIENEYPETLCTSPT